MGDGRQSWRPVREATTPTAGTSIGSRRVLTELANNAIPLMFSPSPVCFSVAHHLRFRHANDTWNFRPLPAILRQLRLP